MAFSGHALTHWLHASQALSFTSKACCQRCASPLSFPLILRPMRNSLGNVPTEKTPTGHTRTQSALPSQLLRSMTGRKVPGSCLHSVDFANALAHFLTPIVSQYSRGTQIPRSVGKPSWKAMKSRRSSARLASPRLAASDFVGP